MTICVIGDSNVLYTFIKEYEVYGFKKKYLDKNNTYYSYIQKLIEFNDINSPQG